MTSDSVYGPTRMRSYDGAVEMEQRLQGGVSGTDEQGEELLEREPELAALAEALERARTGSGSVVVLDGPAGIGKSRLLAHTRLHARAAGIGVLEARGVELEREVSFGVATELFAATLARVGARTREHLLSGQAMFARSLFDHEVPAPVDAAALTRGLYWLTINLTLTAPAQADDLAAAEELRPLLIAVDDAHWCDRPSLSFLSYLAARVAELPVALIVAIRSGEPESATALRAWVGDHPARCHLKPQRLSEEAVARMVAADFTDPEPAFVRACARVSGGNPFLAHELVRALSADHVPATAGSVAEVERLVPDSVLHSVLVRLARLPESAQRLAAACAVLADGSRLRHAGALAGLERATAEQAADALAAAHVLERGEPLRFTHPLIATAVEADQPRFARARAHRSAASLLAADGASADVVAAHLLVSTPEGDRETVEVLRRAAAHALASGDPAAAVRLLERALLEPPAIEQRGAVLLELAEAAIHDGDSQADRHIEEALSLELDEVERTRALIALARLRFQQGRHAESTRLVQDLLDRLDADDPIAQQLVVEELSAASFRASLRAGADARMAPIERAAASGRLPEHPGLVAHLALRYALAGEAPERVRALAERAVATDPLVDPASLGMLAGIVVQALACVDELDAAEELAEAALEGALRGGSLLAYTTASFHRAIPRYHRGALHDSLADLEQALAATHEGWTGADAWIGALQAHLHLERGELEAARAALAFGDGTSEESMDHAILLSARATVALVARDPAAAQRDSEAAGRHLAERFAIDSPGLVPWRDTAALAAAALGEADRARRLAAEGLERARACGVARAIGLALRTAALVDGGERRLDLLEQAVDVLEHSPSRLALVHALVDQGAHLRRAGQRSSAQTPLRRALELADRMGAQPLADAAREELRASGARPRRAAYTGVDALTPTERRVSELAVQGLSNPQIAQALFVTPKTVQTHLTHAYRKLDISSRQQLAAALGAAR